MRIYTRTGDKGETSLFNGVRVGKDDVRIDLLGNLDELSAFIGLLHSSMTKNHDQKTILESVQSTLLSIGSEIANPKFSSENYQDFSEFVAIFEQLMDAMDEHLEPLKNFILPGGAQSAAYAHVCRTITRRCERLLVRLSKDAEINESVKVFLNRLSDYFFVLARFLNKEAGESDVIWDV